jgi:hypothetical protein
MSQLRLDFDELSGLAIGLARDIGVKKAIKRFLAFDSRNCRGSISVCECDGRSDRHDLYPVVLRVIYR